MPNEINQSRRRHLRKLFVASGKACHWNKKLTWNHCKLNAHIFTHHINENSISTEAFELNNMRVNFMICIRTLAGLMIDLPKTVLNISVLKCVFGYYTKLFIVGLQASFVNQALFWTWYFAHKKHQIIAGGVERLKTSSQIASLVSKAVNNKFTAMHPRVPYS